MNDNLIGQNNLRLLYYRYKDSAYFSLTIIAFVIVICIILFFQVIIPQVQSWFSIRDEVIATQARIDTINKNINFVNNIDKSALNEQVDIATRALPLDKNFGQIVGAISDASAKSGVSLDDFSFQVGNVASVSGQPTSIQKDLSAVKLTVSIAGSVDSVNAFVREIREKLPLSEIINIDGDTHLTSITLQFYQKQFPHIVFKDDEPLVPLSNANIALLQKLSGWKPTESQSQGSVASSSGVPLF